MSGKLKVSNEFSFTSLKDYDFKWELLKNGDVVKTGKFKVSAEPLTSEVVSLNLPKINKEEGVEYFLNVFAYIKKESLFLPVGYEVAKEQFHLSTGDYHPMLKVGSNNVNLNETDSVYQFICGNIEFEINKTSGFISSYKISGKELVAESLMPNFWRATTDNDFGNNMQNECEVWRNAGKNAHLKEIFLNKEGDKYTVVSELKLDSVDANYSITYKVSDGGMVQVTVQYESLSDKTPEIPRFGMVMALPKSYKNFSYYGRGPWENYSDRNTSSFIGKYSSDVEDQYFAYIRPQENGNKTDVRWLKLENEDQIGLKITGAQPLSVSVLPFSVNDIDPGKNKNQKHTTDVVFGDKVYLSIDLAQRGVGGDNSWGAHPHNQYRLRDKKYSYTYFINPNTDKE